MQSKTTCVFAVKNVHKTDTTATPENTNDRNLKVMGHLTKNIFGELFADKSYILKKLISQFMEKDIHPVTKQKNNTKNKWLLKLSNKMLLRKRAVIESVNGFPKNIFQIEHPGHRSRYNFVANLISDIVAYFLPKKS